MVIEPRVVQFWSEIILVISNRTRAARSFNFGITRMISAQITLHSVQLPLLTSFLSVLVSYIKVIFYFQSEPLKGKVERILHWRYVNLPIEGTTL